MLFATREWIENLEESCLERRNLWISFKKKLLCIHKVISTGEKYAKRGGAEVDGGHIERIHSKYGS